MLKRLVCEGGGMNGILKFFPPSSGQWTLDLWGEDTNQVLWQWWEDGSDWKRGNRQIFFFQCGFLPDPYICVFLQHLSSLFFYCYWYVFGSGLSFAIFAQTICALTCVLFCAQQYTYLMTITTESILIPWFLGNIKLVFLLFQQICLSKRTANNKYQSSCPHYITFLLHCPLNCIHKRKKKKSGGERAKEKPVAWFLLVIINVADVHIHSCSVRTDLLISCCHQHFQLLNVIILVSPHHQLPCLCVTEISLLADQCWF